MKTFTKKALVKRGWTILLCIPLIPVILVSCEDLLNGLDSGDPRDKLVDTWKVQEFLVPLKSALEPYWVEIEKHPDDSTRVIIYNFYNVDADAEAVLSGNNLSLPLQLLEGGYEVSGSGQIRGSNANEILWSYTVDDGSGESIRYSSLYTRLTF